MPEHHERRYCPPGHHLPAVTMTRRFRDRLKPKWWVRCWECDLKQGPYVNKEWAVGAARIASKAVRYQRGAEAVRS